MAEYRPFFSQLVEIFRDKNTQVVVVVVVVVVEIFVHGAVKATVTCAAVSAKQMSLQQFLELADCRVGLTQ